MDRDGYRCGIGRYVNGEWTLAAGIGMSPSVPQCLADSEFKFPRCASG